MQSDDVHAALQIIEDHDEEEAEGAAQTFAQDLSGYFVAGSGDEMFGVTGATPIDGTAGSYVLGWTAIKEERPQEDYRAMLNELVASLQEFGGRKIFAQVSDYIDPDDGDLSASLRRALTDAGFLEELRHKNYYDSQESQIIYGLRLTEPNFARIEPDNRIVRLTDIDEIPETNDSYWLSWELSDSATPLLREDFQKIIDQVREWDGRCIFVSFPTGIPSVDTLMRNAGFRFDGRLADFYDDGVDDLRFRYDL